VGRKKNEKSKKKKGHVRRSLPSHVPSGVRLISPPPGVKKMSEVMEEFIDPYLDEARTEHQLRELLSIATIAWNAALMPAAEQDALVEDVMATVPQESRPFFLNWLMELIRRKLAFFADNKRLILSYELTWNPDNPYISVMSSFPPGEQPPLP
jgi:hypothetical protein